MSSSTTPATFSELYVDLQNRVKDATGVTATQDIAKRYINIGLHDMHIGNGEKFPWAERSAILLTHPRYTTGTVAVTVGSTAIVGTSTLWDTANDFGDKNMRAGGRMTIGSDTEVYEVKSVTDDTNAILTSKFVGSTTSGLSYVYFEDEYDLASDFLRPIDAQHFDSNGSISLISRTEFRRRYPRNSTTGDPYVACIEDRPVSGNTTARRRIRLWKPTTSAELIPYSYVTSLLVSTTAGVGAVDFVNDNDEPIVPLRYRHAIVLWALKTWYRDRSDDGRFAAVEAEYQDLLSRIVGDHEIGSKRPQIRPRTGIYRRTAARPYGGGGRGRSRFDLGHFDEMGR